MSTHPYTESHLVKQPAIGLFAALGWQTVSAMKETFGVVGTIQARPGAACRGAHRSHR